MVAPDKSQKNLDEIISLRLSRRKVAGALVSSLLLPQIAPKVYAGTDSTNSGQHSQAKQQDILESFSQVEANTTDDITLPEGFGWYVLASWGDLLNETETSTARGQANPQSLRMGNCTDGMEVFRKRGKTLIAVNNEFSFRPGEKNPFPFFQSPELALEGMLEHGVTIFEIVNRNGRWSLKKNSRVNRRITPKTKMTMDGPLKGSDLVKTSADEEGTTCLGTWNNCGSGRTPWNTYLTCEENFHFYFESSDSSFSPDAMQARYGLGNKGLPYGWMQVDDRFDLSKEKQESHRCGYVVEIDPFNPESIPVKHTALGRFKHENAELVISKNRHAVVYMGDDERGEYLYRFISDGNFPNREGNNPLASGKLFVAKFSDDGSGEWVPLTQETTGMSEEKIRVFAREAGTVAGGTPMDRPEWITAHPEYPKVFCSLTNNTRRKEGAENLGGSPMDRDGPNPRRKNKFGHILCWEPVNGDHEANSFSWDIFAMAGNPAIFDDDQAGSSNINSENMFNSPDGLKFDKSGRLWIQTDGDDSNSGDFEGQGNNQMLVASPETGLIKRFMVGPSGAEVTGLTWSPDNKTMFAGIQHPGLGAESEWPDSSQTVNSNDNSNSDSREISGSRDKKTKTKLPRSAVIAIYRKDGMPFA